MSLFSRSYLQDSNARLAMDFPFVIAHFKRFFNRFFCSRLFILHPSSLH